jgi:hypothetical protein
VEERGGVRWVKRLIEREGGGNWKRRAVVLSL